MKVGRLGEKHYSGTRGQWKGVKLKIARRGWCGQNPFAKERGLSDGRDGPHVGRDLPTPRCDGRGQMDYSTGCPMVNLNQRHA